MRRAVVAALLAFAAAYASPGRNSVPEDGGFTIMSYNIHHGAGMDGRLDFGRIADIIKAARPRFVGLQEVDMGTTRVGKANTCRILADACGMEYTFCKSIKYRGGKYGNAILSREKPLSVKRFSLPSKTESRSLVLCEFEDCWVGTMHPDAFDPAANLASVPVIEKAVKACARKPVFLTGDWNASPTSETLSALGKFLTVLSPQDRTTRQPKAKDPPGAPPRPCIDYIAVDSGHRAGFRVTRGEVVQDDVASDHKPVVVTVQTLDGRAPLPSASADSGAWRQVGPGGGGWLESILVSGHDARRMFVGCDVAGVFVSEDAGRSYLNGTAGLEHFFIEAMAEHPSDPDFLLAGTLGGVHRSTDRGKTWQPCREGFPPVSAHSHSCPIARILAVPGRPSSFLAFRGNPRGMGGASINVPEVYRTDDAGETWRRIDAKGELPEKTRIMDAALTSGKPFGLVVSTSEKGVYRSEDGGVHWRAANEGLPHLRLRHIASAPSNPDVIYVALALSAGERPWDAGVCKSVDGGRTWRDASDGLPRRVGKKGNRMLGSWTNCLVVDPRNADVVYAGQNGWVTPGVWKTTNGGKSWMCVYDNNRRMGWLNFWGPAVECLSVGAVSPYAVAFGTGGYVMRSEDGGATWRQCYTRENADGTASSIGLETTCLHEIVPDRERIGRFFLCYYDIGLLVTEDNGATCRQAVRGVRHPDSDNCFGVAQAEDERNNLWAAVGQWYGNDGTIVRSRDGGESWDYLPETNGWIRATPADLVIVDGGRPYALACRARGLGIAVSTNGGESWRYVTTNDLPRAKSVSALTAADGVLYAGIPADDSRFGEVWKSEDRGASWTRLTQADLPLPLVQGVSARGGQLLVATRELYQKADKRYLGGGVWHSADGGTTWKKVASGKFCTRAIFLSDGRWAVSMNDHAYHDSYRGKGVAISADCGATWKSLRNSSLLVPNVSCLVENPHLPGELWAGTAGASVFVRKVEP